MLLLKQDVSENADPMNARDFNTAISCDRELIVFHGLRWQFYCCLVLKLMTLFLMLQNCLY